MTITELLAAIRQPYVQMLAEAAKAQEAYVEPVYRTSDGAPATEGLWDLPCRADVIAAAGENAGESIQVNSQSQLDFAPIHFSIADTAVALSPFIWDWLPLEVSGLPQDQATQVLTDWFNQWFDGEDENPVNEAGLQEVIHFMSDPEPTADGFKLTIDLGSAPSEAVEDLLFALSDAGSAKVQLG